MSETNLTQTLQNKRLVLFRSQCYIVEREALQRKNLFSNSSRRLPVDWS